MTSGITRKEVRGLPPRAPFRGASGNGLSFRDPIYDTLEARYEMQYGLPRGLLSRIRTRGERSNANQVSEAGARTVYQFIPSTRQGMIRNYGVDPWAGPEQAAHAAALHLRDDYRHFGNWDDAVSAYHGGRNRNNWRTRTRAYSRRVGPVGGR